MFHSGEVLQEIKDVEHQTGVVILRDTKKCHLGVFEPEMNRTEAASLIADMLRDDTSSFFSINLNTDQYE